jgi:hypothetical protein
MAIPRTKSVDLERILDEEQLVEESQRDQKATSSAIYQVHEAAVDYHRTLEQLNALYRRQVVPAGWDANCVSSSACAQKLRHTSQCVSRQHLQAETTRKQSSL